MAKKLLNLLILLLLILNLVGCNAIGENKINLSFIYIFVAVVSFVLLVICCLRIRQNKFWFIMLFSSVFIVNLGYSLLAVSQSLEMALNANRIAYLGSVFLPFSMFMIVMNVTNTKSTRIFKGVLFSLAIIVFLIAASPGILDIYYKEVSFEIIEGAGRLIKTYGPLHILYLFYLIGYFFITAYIVINAIKNKKIQSVSHAVILTFTVFINIAVWFIEQITDIDFEMLSVSYIICELFLFGIQFIMDENQRLSKIVRHVEMVNEFSDEENLNTEVLKQNSVNDVCLDFFVIEEFIEGISKLTATEKEIFDAHISRMTTAEIIMNFNISENTLKYHNRNIYGKLGVSSKKQLLEVYKQIKKLKEK